MRVRHGFWEPARTAPGRSSRRVPFGVMQEDVVESETVPGTYYPMRRRGDGTWWCGCPGHGFRGECKHAKRKAEQGC